MPPLHARSRGSPPPHSATKKTKKVTYTLLTASSNTIPSSPMRPPSPQLTTSRTSLTISAAVPTSSNQLPHYRFRLNVGAPQCSWWGWRMGCEGCPASKLRGKEIINSASGDVRARVFVCCTPPGRRRCGRLRWTNIGDEAEEMSLSFFFSDPKADYAGTFIC